MMRLTRAAVWAGCLLLALSPLQAATLWLEPDPSAPEAGQPVKLRLLLGDRFSGEERPIDGDAVVSFQRLRKNGRDNLPRETGATPAASYEAGGDGVEIVTLTWKGRAGEYFCKTVQVVGDAAEGHPLRYSETGQRLELVPQTDPVALARDGGTLEIQVLFEREPLAGVRLLALPENPGDGEHVIAVTDEIGLATFELPRAGMWLIELAYKYDGGRYRSTLVLRAGSK